MRSTENILYLVKYFVIMMDVRVDAVLNSETTQTHFRFLESNPKSDKHHCKRSKHCLMTISP